MPIKQFRAPTRGQIAEMVKGNPELIRKFEALFQQAGVDLPSEVDESLTEIASRTSSMSAIISELADQIASQLQPVTVSDDDDEDISPSAPALAVEMLGDVDLKDLSDEVFLQFDLSARAWTARKIGIADLDLTSFTIPSDGNIIVWRTDPSPAFVLEDMPSMMTVGYTGTFNSLDGSLVTVANGLIISVT